MIAAIVLSAGKSERMRGNPKALLSYKGRTFLERILDAIAESGISDTTVVVGHHRREIVEAINLPRVVFNPDYEQGMSTSVQAGLKSLRQNVEGAALFLVDHPLIDASTIELLTRQLQPGKIVLPSHAGRRGHPVILSSELFEEVLNLSPDQGLNAVVRREPGRIIEVPVPNAGVLRDIDTPEELEKLLQESP